MAPELEKYFDEVNSTLRSEGWKMILEDVEAKTRSLELTILSFPLEPALSDYAKGKLEVYREFVVLVNTMANAYDKLKEDEESVE